MPPLWLFPIVQLVVICHFEDVTGRVVFPTEPRFVTISEHICIKNNAAGKKFPRSRIDLSHFILGGIQRERIVPSTVTGDGHPIRHISVNDRFWQPIYGVFLGINQQGSELSENGWRPSSIGNLKGGRIVLDFSYPVYRSREVLAGLNGNENISAFDDTKGVRLSLGNSCECPCNPYEKRSSNSSDSRPKIVKGFSDMPDDDKRKVISGAIFLVGIWLLLAYISCERGDNEEKHKRRDE